MMRNHHLAGAIADASWNKFYTMLEYKTFLHGGQIIRVPRFYASSQACHICGHRYPKTKDLSVREWTCPVCGTHHDRDINAAINIKQKAFPEKNPKYYGVSLFKDEDEAKYKFGLPQYPKKLAKGYVVKICGPLLNNGEDGSSHVTWWLYKDADISEGKFEVIEDE